MVTQSELRSPGRDIGALALSRLDRERSVPVVVESVEAPVVEGPKKVTYDVFTIDKATRERPQLLTVVATFDTKEEAERFKRVELDPGMRNVPKGIRKTPTGERVFDKRSGLEVVGPPRGSRVTGRELERARLRAEKILSKPKESRSVDEVNFIKKVKVETKPTPAADFASSLLSRQKQVQAQERAQQLASRLSFGSAAEARARGFEVPFSEALFSPVGPKGKVIEVPIPAPTSFSPLTKGFLETKTAEVFSPLFPRNPGLTAGAVESVRRIKEEPLKTAAVVGGVGVLAAAAPLLATGLGIVATGALIRNIVRTPKGFERERVIGSVIPETALFSGAGFAGSRLRASLSSSRATRQTRGFLLSEKNLPKIRVTVPSRLLRVREFTGATIRAAGLRQGVRNEALLVSTPKLGPSKLLDISKVQVPKILLATAKGDKTTRSFVQRVGGPGEVQVLRESSVTQPISRVGVLTAAESRRFLTPLVRRQGLVRDLSPVTSVLRGSVDVNLRPLAFFRDLPVKQKQKPSSSSFFRPKRVGVESRELVGFQPKLPGQLRSIILKLPDGRVLAGEERLLASGKVKRDIRVFNQPKQAEVFVKSGFGKKRVTTQKVVRPEDPKPVEIGGGPLVQLLKPLKTRVEAKSVFARSRVKTQQVSRRQTVAETLQEFGKKFRRKKQEGLFVVEEVVARPVSPFELLAKPFAARRVALSSVAQANAVFLGSKSVSAQLLGRVPAQLSGQLAAQVSAQIPAQLSGQLAAQVPAQIPAQVSAQVPAQVSAQVPVLSRLFRVPKVPRRPPVRRPPKGSDVVESEGLVEERAPSYDVQLRRGDKRGDRFVTIARRVALNKALSLGSRSADNFVEASFRLKPNTKKPVGSDNLFVPDLSKFRRPKKSSKLPANTFIERARSRLDSLGERQQISFFRRRAALKNALSTKKRAISNKKRAVRKSAQKGFFGKVSL